jgi:shikimate kinase
LICLIGFMGAGKTTVGKELAQQLDCPFIDLDEAIEAMERARISEIFTRSGQAAFRQSETEALRRILQQRVPDTSYVIAAGGGTYSKPENQEALQAAGAAVIFLSAPIEELWQRVNKQADVSRPMIRDRASFESLFHSRVAQFRSAALEVSTSGLSAKQIATEIRKRLRSSAVKG